jgi:eukaryotic-like serine/threonine-protein kinase
MKSLPCSSADWPRFSALLDACLEEAPEARMDWLEKLPASDAHLKVSLQSVISKAQSLSQDDWLDQPINVDEDAISSFSDNMLLGPWRLRKRLGRGGMGEVWLVARSDGSYERDVALKLPHPHLMAGVLKERFYRERDILARLEHVQIARFYDAGIAENDQPWLALEYVEGTPITDYCQSKAMNVRQRVALMRAVAAGIQAAHTQLVVHRDLKPANVLVTTQGEVKLLDFGIAKLVDDDEHDAALTQFGHRVATPDYAAPEQLQGNDISAATDVYAMGVMLYELLTGTRPFKSRSRLGLMLDDRQEAPLASSKVNGKQRSELIGDLDSILSKALETEPSQRYASADAFSDDLQRYLNHQPIRARRIGRWQRMRKFVRRHRQGVAMACVMCCILGAGFAGVLWQSKRAEEEARRAGAIKDFLIEVFAANDPRIASDQPRGGITAKAMLDASASKIQTRFADDPDVQIELLRTVADLYLQLGEYERYEKYQNLQLAKVRERYGPLHPNILDDAVESALRLCASGERDQCSAAVKKSDELLVRAGNPDPQLRAQWWLSNGLMLQNTEGRGKETEHAYQQAVDLYQQHAPNSRGYVTALHEQAGFYNSIKLDYPRAIAKYREALAVAESLPNRNDAELQTLYGNLGLVYQQLGQFSEAAEAFKKSADIADHTTGADFPTAWVPRSNAARTLHLAGQREAAHREFEKLMPLLPKDGNDVLEAITVRTHYGERLSSEGRPALGIPVLELVERAYAKNSTHYFQLRLVRRHLGEAYSRAGRHDDAGRMLKTSLNDYLKNQQDSEQPVMAIRESWGRWLLKNKQLNDAQQQFENIIANANERKFAHIALAHAGLARVALQQGKIEVALRESESALKLWNEVSGFRDVRMQPYMQRVRADALAAQGELALAQQLEDAAASASARYDHPDSDTRIRRMMAEIKL